MGGQLELKWKRPESTDYPRVWHRFNAKDLNSDDLVEYRIQDLPESRNEEALELMVEYFCGDEPLCRAYGVPNDTDSIDDLKRLWRCVLNQKTVLACFRDGSDDIVSLNMVFVTYGDEHFMEEAQRQSKGKASIKVFNLMGLLYENFDVCDHYKVDKYLTAVGLVVTPKYRGRAIGDHMLKTRKVLCEALGIKLTSTVFTSDFSNRNADHAGFELNESLTYNDIRTKHPELELPPIKHDVITVKSILF